MNISLHTSALLSTVHHNGISGEVTGNSRNKRKMRLLLYHSPQNLGGIKGSSVTPAKLAFKFLHFEKSYRRRPEYMSSLSG